MKKYDKKLDLVIEKDNFNSIELGYGLDFTKFFGFPDKRYKAEEIS
jgi:hypothetical protein